MVTATQEEVWSDLLSDKKKFIETLLVVENKQRRRVPFIYNDIQTSVHETCTGMDIWVKPSQVGFSTERIADRLVDTLTCPGTNTVLVAYEDFITERLLTKVKFFYNHLASLNIPNFPIMKHDSTYEKTFEFWVNGVLLTTSSIYIASARSKTAGRAETIHHLLLDEMAFYVLEARENIILPAMARIPPDGTVDAFSTPNGEENDFHEWYVLAKEGQSMFTAHFYPWFSHKEYRIELGDKRISMIPECDKVEFAVSSDEEQLMSIHGLNFSQIRWRRWKKKQMESLKRKGEITTLFEQEFPENDVDCFLATGDQWYEVEWIENLAKTCYDAPLKIGSLNVWYKPEKEKQYYVIVDPGQAKITQSVISVMTFEHDEYGNICPKWCARDAGWYEPEDEYSKACRYSDMYNRAMLVWEANGHGLAFTTLAKNRRPIYFRTDLVNKVPTLQPGWFTTGVPGKSGTKDYMLKQVRKYLPTTICHDIELVRQFRNFKKIKGRLEITGMDDIHDTFAIGVSVFDPNPVRRGMQGQSGWKQGWGKRKRRN